MNTAQNRFLYDYLTLYGNVTEPIKSLEGPCYSCHITYENFNQFGLTDPFVYSAGSYGYTVGNIAVSTNVLNAQYGYIINWPAGNRAVDYFGTGNVAISAELDALSITPSNSAIDSTIKIRLSNYSGQQTGNTVYDNTMTIHQGDTQTLNVNNIKEDYFNIILLLDGIWGSATLNLKVNGTDKGNESFIINASNPPTIYEIPMDISKMSYFKTNGTYKAVRLDYIWSEWRNYSMGNIATSEVIMTNSTYGWISANSCSAPDAMCHINQEVTYMGLSDGTNGTNPDKSFYTHKMEYVTSKQCKICHLK